MNAGTRWVTGGESDPTAILCSENYNQIATVNDALDGWQDNANVIAAAPDLLESADNALGVLIACAVSAGGVDDGAAILDAQRQLRAAIAKATQP